MIWNCEARTCVYMWLSRVWVAFQPRDDLLQCSKVKPNLYEHLYTQTRAHTHTVSTDTSERQAKWNRTVVGKMRIGYAPKSAIRVCMITQQLRLTNTTAFLQNRQQQQSNTHIYLGLVWFKSSSWYNHFIADIDAILNFLSVVVFTSAAFFFFYVVVVVCRCIALVFQTHNHHLLVREREAKKKERKKKKLYPV